MFGKESDTSIRVISQGYNFWKVQVLFNDPRITTGEIPDRLREVKSQLANQFGIPDALLEYVQLLSKRQTRNGVLVEMQIVKHDMPCGAPRFRSLPAKAPDGTIFSDMVIEADFYPRDEFEKTLTKQTIRERLQAQGFELSQINWDSIDAALLQMDQNGAPIMNTKIAEGILPEFGRNSILTYGVCADQSDFLESSWIGVRPVGRGDFLVESTESVSGLRRGMNLRGREIEPRSGVSTSIELGEGTRFSMRENKIIAGREGIVTFERFGRDRRQKDRRDVVPARLIANVLPMLCFAESKVYDIKIFDATMIIGTVKAGSKIQTSHPLFIDGNVESGSDIECTDSLRIRGNIHKANINCKKHFALTGSALESVIECGLTFQVDGKVTNSTVYAMDIIAEEITGGYIEVLNQSKIDRKQKTEDEVAAIHVNLQKFLENEQQEGKHAIEELRDSLNRLIEIFGPDVALQTTEGSIHRMLLKWLRDQKAAGIPPYSYAEVKEFRTLLGLVPTIREQLVAVGMELREVTAKLNDTQPQT